MMPMKDNMKTTKLPKNQMVPLASLNVPLAPAEAPAEESSTILEVTMPGADVTAYNRQAKAEKAAKTAKDKARPTVETFALDELFIYNTENPEAPKTTVRVTDDEKSKANVSFKNAYGTLPDVTAVLASLRLLGVKDPNQFVEKKVVIGFDTSIFYDAEGKLKVEFYTAMMNAIQDCAWAHDEKSPFTSNEVLAVKPNFHQDRWTICATGTANERADVQAYLRKTFKNTVSITPVV